MLQFIYVTDLHGHKRHYDNLFNFSIKHNIKLIHIGADLLPKGSNILRSQKLFIEGYLKSFYYKCNKEGIKILCFWGNDDIYSYKTYFKKYATLLDESPFKFNEYEFKAYPFCCDYPFGLKSATKLDYLGWTCPEPYLSIPVDCSSTGDLIEIVDIIKYFEEKGTIEEDLANITATDKTIMAFHQPPYGLGLDVCYNGRKTGSKAIFDWIKKTQPLCVLAGHIHESYDVTGIWKASIDKTIVIQPGQYLNDSRTRAVLITLEKDIVETELLTLR